MRKFENEPWHDFERKTPVRGRMDKDSWFDRFKKRQEVVDTEENEFVFSFMTPALIGLISDWHLGHPTTNYQRIEDEVDAIVATPNATVILAGDEIDNMHWNPGQYEQMEQTPEQIGFLFEIFDYLISYNKLLHHIGGDHDGWLKKQGYDIQAYLRQNGVTTSKGPTYFTMEVGDQEYKISGAHQLPGHSIYNPNHPQMRSVRFGSMHGSDVVFSGHNHKKGIAKGYSHELGHPKEVTFIALGPYKEGDSWLAKKGWGRQKAVEMFGAAVYLDAYEHFIEAEADILRACDRMSDEP